MSKVGQVGQTGSEWVNDPLSEIFFLRHKELGWRKKWVSVLGRERPPVQKEGGEHGIDG
jgi:hypothetical protein